MNERLLVPVPRSKAAVPVSANLGQFFVRRLGSPVDCTAIVRAVTTLGADLSMAITAEGETQQQFDALAGIGCTEVQGFLSNPAVPGDVVMDLPRTMSVPARASQPAAAAEPVPAW
jgi:EAL domain-containing protein (putative c-di-GMP-specific phosphodiesterase class I)